MVAVVGAWRHFFRRRPARRPENPRRILIAHQLLLGDTIMLTPLFAKLRRNYPDAEIFMLCPPVYAPLYAHRPYGVQALPFVPRSIANTASLIKMSSFGFDWALIPAENRWGWLARAMGARWIVAFDGDPGDYKNYPIDELRPFARVPKAWGEMAEELADGAPPPPYNSGDWPEPPYETFPLPDSPYCVLHVGASSPLRHWGAARWMQVADWIVKQGILPVWTCGKGEEPLIDAADSTRRFPRYAGNLTLPQLWQLLAGARLVVCPDTGIAHLAHLTGTPSVVLYGPGSPLLVSGGEFWRNHPEEKVFIPDLPCRNENLVFRRNVPWAGHCGRTPQACSSPRCMDDISTEMVIESVKKRLL
ncbi:MAG: glycosyltransferase family 9 protein [Sulfuricella sp.]|nr:glycosyltransferase family 9 protein [Sulfuricella sp.]